MLQMDYPMLQQEMLAASERNPFLERLWLPNPTRGVAASSQGVSGTAPDIADNQVNLHSQLKDLLDPRMDEWLFSAVSALIDQLDEHGFLSQEHADIRAALKLSRPAFQQALATLQALGDGGLGTANTRDYLVYQLTRMRAPVFWRDVCRNHLDKVAKRQYGVIAGLYGVSPAQAAACCRAIADLNPYPLRGAVLRDEAPAAVPPELEIIHDQGTLKAVLLNPLSERFVLSPHTQAYQGGAKSDTERAYMRSNLQQARFLLSALRRREDTLLRVGTLICIEQEAFFLGGPLKALSQLRAAKELQLHPSTISRALRQKHLVCQRGHYPLTAFFQPGKADGLARSAVQDFIKAIIQEAGEETRLSDRAIAEQLLDRYGIAIARRTVAKYRQQLCLPSAFFKLGQA